MPNNVYRRICSSADRKMAIVSKARGKGAIATIVVVWIVGLGLLSAGIAFIYLGEENHIINVIVLGSVCLAVALCCFLMVVLFVMRPIFKEQNRGRGLSSMTRVRTTIETDVGGSTDSLNQTRVKLNDLNVGSHNDPLPQTNVGVTDHTVGDINDSSHQASQQSTAKPTENSAGTGNDSPLQKSTEISDNNNITDDGVDKEHLKMTKNRKSAKGRDRASTKPMAPAAKTSPETDSLDPENPSSSFIPF